jgi:hypothetical protein
MDRGPFRKTLYIENPAASSKFRGPFRGRCWRAWSSILKVEKALDTIAGASFRKNWRVIYGFRPQNSNWRLRWSFGWHVALREACVEAKQSRGELITVKCKDQNMDHFASKVKWFIKISKSNFGNYVKAL